ncbi:beta strand repeat-containing protein [Aquimarina agarilytica]|uniref:beta strand repeat-containing protein n=1 Tax=Aquimarina agarilytica TaxID=1087449 RepID=UPI0003090FC6|nr:hypothetical protein [Aquimarina agarilytica]
MDKITQTSFFYNKLLLILICFTIGAFQTTYAQDIDGDTVTNQLDLDDDNDGILDAVESGCDPAATTGLGLIWDPNIDASTDAFSRTNFNTGNPKVDRYEPSQFDPVFGFPVDFVQPTVSNVSFGSGLVDESLDPSNEVEVSGYYFLSGATETDVTGAKTNNDYLEFSFTTLTDKSVLLRFFNLQDVPTFIPGVYETARGVDLRQSFTAPTDPVFPLYVDFTYQIEISTDSFTTSTVLIPSTTTVRRQNGLSFTNSLDEQFEVPAAFDYEEFGVFPQYQLHPGQLYTVRLYVYASEDQGGLGRVSFDNFRLNVSDCTTGDTDNDGIVDMYDLDSDNDGCADLEEGGGNFTVVDNGTTAMGSLSDGNGGIVTQNLGNTVGATLAGVPNIAGAGQVLGNTKDGINYCDDFDEDGVPDEVDLDDDNDGILDELDVCNISTSTTDPIGTAVNWEAGGFRIFTVGGNTDATGALDNGFEQAVIREGINISTLSSASDYTSTGSVGGGTADTSVITFSNGTITYSDTYAADAQAELRTTTAGGFISGDTGSGVYVESEFNGGVDDEYTVSYNFTTPVTLFSVDIVDIFDTFGNPPNPSDLMLQYEIIAGGKLIAFLRDEPTGDDTVGTVDIYDAVGTLRGNIGSGQNIETTISFLTPNPVSTVAIRHRIVQGFLGPFMSGGTNFNAVRDPHGFDQFSFSTDSLCTNSKNTDSDGDGCPDAVEASGDFRPTDLTSSNNLADADEGDVDGTGVPLDGPGGSQTTQNATAGYLDAGVENCTDSDLDGVPDVTDIDDDNDGVLDTGEGLRCFDSPIFNSGEAIPVDSYRLMHGFTTTTTFNDVFSTTTNAPFLNPGSIIISANNITINNQPQYAFIENITATDLADAKSKDEYLTYTFTTVDNIINGSIDYIYKFRQVDPTLSFTTTYSISNDGTNFTDLGTIFTASGGSAGFPNGSQPTEIANYPLQASTTYTVRLYFYDVEAAAGNVILDDPGLFFDYCLGSDNDNDGVLNHLDLDSDGDGCPDLVEAGVAPTTGIGQGTIENGTGGVVITTTPNVDNAQFTFISDATTDNNGDGLLDSIDDNGGTGMLDGTPEYTSSYSTFASDSTVNACLDSDGDSIADVFDLDDDNDGILDVDECSSQFVPTENDGSFGLLSSGSRNLETPITSNGYSFASLNNAAGQYAIISKATTGWSTAPFWEDLAGHTTGLDDDAYLAVNGSNNVGIFYSQSVTLPVNSDFTLSLWGANAVLAPDTASFPAEVGIRVLNSGNNVVASASTGQLTIQHIWVEASATFNTGSQTDYTIEVFNISTGINGNDFAIDDISLIDTSNLCITDTDNDGIPNNLDLDSDGDGCPDAVEGDLSFEQSDLSDASTTLLNQPNNNNNDGSISTGYLGSTTESVLFNLGTTVDTDPMSPTYGVPLSTLANTPNTQGIGGSQDVNDDTACCDIVPPMIAPN